MATDAERMVMEFDDGFADYRRDESRLPGQAAAIAFPRSESDVRAVLEHAQARGLAVTIQGGRTGITGGAVPAGGLVLNLERMDAVGPVAHHANPLGATIPVEPGVRLANLRKILTANAFDNDHACFLPVDPTETSASVGGMVACNASGARSFRYGAIRRYVTALRVMLVDGDLLVLKRGRERAVGRSFTLVTEGGRRLEGELPSYRMPAVKSAAGYYAAEGMDLIDLFIGAEGTLGVVTGIELGLLPEPRQTWGMTGFFARADEAEAFVVRMREQRDGVPDAIEYFDANALALLRRQKRATAAFAAIPEVPERWQAAVYTEYSGDEESVVEAAVSGAAEVMTECGGDADDTWLATDGAEMERLKFFRHAVPESVNMLIDARRKSDPSITKLGTDLAVPDGQLGAVLAMYRSDLSAAGLDYVMFGHIGNNHLHVNILPRSAAEYAQGKALYDGWARRIVAAGGTVSAEHGIGRLKTGFLAILYGADGMAQMRATKRVFDPEGRLNPGVLFPV